MEPQIQIISYEVDLNKEEMKHISKEIGKVCKEIENAELEVNNGNYIEVFSKIFRLNLEKIILEDKFRYYAPLQLELTNHVRTIHNETIHQDHDASINTEKVNANLELYHNYQLNIESLNRVNNKIVHINNSMNHIHKSINLTYKKQSRRCEETVILDTKKEFLQNEYRYYESLKLHFEEKFRVIDETKKKFERYPSFDSLEANSTILLNKYGNLYKLNIEAFDLIYKETNKIVNKMPQILEEIESIGKKILKQDLDCAEYYGFLKTNSNLVLELEFLTIEWLSHKSLKLEFIESLRHMNIELNFLKQNL